MRATPSRVGASPSTSWTGWGGGDAFASGLIYAMMNQYKPMDMVNFAVASSVIKHTIHGDGNITDDAGVIRNLMNMNYDIKR